MAPKTDSMTLDINVVSARGLSTEVDPTSNLKIYAVVSITGAGQNEQKAQTNVDEEGGGNPTWNFPVKFAVAGGSEQDFKSHLVFALKCEDRRGDRDVGEVHVSVAELLQSAGDGNSMRYVDVSYQVKKPSGQTAGVLNFEYKFGGSPTIDTPGTGYATRNVGGHPPQGYYYPPPPPAAGYGVYPPPPPQLYGPYPPPSPSHYMPPQPYPPYNVGPSVAPPPYPYAYPPHPSQVQARAPPVVAEQRSKPKKKSGWGSALGVVGALAVGVISGGSAPSFDSMPAPVSVPDVTDFTSGLQIPDPTAYAPPDFSNFYPLPDPSTLLDTVYVDYSSLV